MRMKRGEDSETVPRTNMAWAASGQTKSEPSFNIFMERRGGRLKGIEVSR